MAVPRALKPAAGYPTYSALGARSARPSDYEIVSSRLLYYPERGFEVDVPLRHWYARYQQGSPFRCDDWESFSDPQETTYTAYTTRSRDLELELDRVIEEAAQQGDPGQLSAEWREQLAQAMAPLRYPLHGLHMLACYVGQMAPSGRITLAALFQAGAELRRIDRLAYRTGQLAELSPALAADARERWERSPALQPLREAVERLLVTYDWGEAFVGLNLCLKPLFDALLFEAYAKRSAHAGDEVLAAILRSFERDCDYQMSWSSALVACVRSEAAIAAQAAWIDKWQPFAARAIEALAPHVCSGPSELDALMAEHRAWLASLSGGRS
jgi:toluene monooxygenase system protein E